MATLSSESLPEKRGVDARLVVRDIWASLAICVMWLAVLFDALFGPDFVSGTAGGNYTRIPSAIVIAIFAWLGTRAVAKYGFGRSGED